MNENSFSSNAAAPELFIADAEPVFYVVSKRKFTILFLSTMGLYHLYWFYKNWDDFRDQTPYAAQTGKTIWPVMRAIFVVFFVHALFRTIRDYGVDKPKVKAWSHASHATSLVMLLLLSRLLDRLAEKSIGSPLTDILSLVIVPVMLPVFFSVQEMINVACNDPTGAGNARLTAANYAWIVIGAILWSIMILGLALPDPG